MWDPVGKFCQSPNQSNESFSEQKVALNSVYTAICDYIDPEKHNLFTKCRVISGSLGCGKSFLMNYMVLYAISQGLNVAVTSMVAARATNLDGCHVHRMFCIPVKKNCPIYRLAEHTLINLMKDPVSYHILTVIDILFFDEIGQCSAENLSLLDIIFRKVRKNNIFFGGVLLIGTLDHKQLVPTQGKFFYSHHIYYLLSFLVLKNLYVLMVKLISKDYKTLQECILTSMKKNLV